jgi:hypothetical protein
MRKALVYTLRATNINEREVSTTTGIIRVIRTDGGFTRFVVSPGGGGPIGESSGHDPFRGRPDSEAMSASASAVLSLDCS